MSPDQNIRPAWMQEVLEKIDKRPFSRFIETVAMEISPSADRFFIHDMLRRAVRCILLLDYLYKTNDRQYDTEFYRQRDQFYSIVPDKDFERIENAEYVARQFFDQEKDFIREMRGGGRFTWKDIQTFTMSKSNEGQFYGTVLECTAPGWAPAHTEALRTQTILFNIGKDIHYYADDMVSGLPNVLYMALTAEILPSAIPHNLPEAVTAAHQMAIDRKIISYAEMFKQSVPPDILAVSPTLNSGILENMQDIRNSLALPNLDQPISQ